MAGSNPQTARGWRSRMAADVLAKLESIRTSARSRTGRVLRTLASKHVMGKVVAKRIVALR